VSTVSRHLGHVRNRSHELTDWPRIFTMLMLLFICSRCVSTASRHRGRCPTSHDRYLKLLPSKDVRRGEDLCCHWTTMNAKPNVFQKRGNSSSSDERIQQSSRRVRALRSAFDCDAQRLNVRFVSRTLFGLPRDQSTCI